MQLIRLFENTKPARARCRGCEASIVWHDTLTGRSMPMNDGAAVIRSELDPVSGRTILFYDAADTHWNTCPEKQQFKRRA